MNGVLLFSVSSISASQTVVALKWKPDPCVCLISLFTELLTSKIQQCKSASPALLWSVHSPFERHTKDSDHSLKGNFIMLPKSLLKIERVCQVQDMHIWFFYLCYRKYVPLLLWHSSFNIKASLVSCNPKHLVIDSSNVWHTPLCFGFLGF